MVGPFLFSPTIRISWQHRDNIFFTPDNEVADQGFAAGATLLLEVSVNESFIYFPCSQLSTDYRTYDLEDKWNHFFDVGGTFTFTSGLMVDATYNSITGNLQTRYVDEGGELYFGDPHIEKQFPRVGVQYWFTHRDGVFVEVGWTNFYNSDPQTGQIRSDDILKLGLGMGYRLTHYFSLGGSYVCEDRDSLYRYFCTTKSSLSGWFWASEFLKSSNRIRRAAVCGTVRS